MCGRGVQSVIDNAPEVEPQSIDQNNASRELVGQHVENREYEAPYVCWQLTTRFVLMGGTANRFPPQWCYSKS